VAATRATGLGALVAATRATGSLKQLFAREWRRKQTRAPPQLNDYTRISGLSGICPREEVLCAVHGVSRKDNLGADTLLTFLHGTSLHWGLQNHALPELGVLYGQWKCLDCGTTHGGVEKGVPISETVVLRPNACAKCGNASKGGGDVAFQYVEHHFINDTFLVRGHPDGFLALPGLPGLGILEAKSIGGRNAWEVKQAPHYGHVIQAQAYMWLSGLKWAVIFYWAKGEQGIERSLAEHFIEYDEETIVNLKRLLTSIPDGIRSGILPERVCVTDSCTRANKCSAVKKCFQEA